MNDANEDLIDRLLQEQFEGPVPDDDFCLRVMDRLPPRRRRYGWPLATGTLAGIVLCWLSLLSAPITGNAWRDWLAAEPSASAITLVVTIMGMATLAMAWAIVEAGDRPLAGSRRRTR